MVMAWPGLIGEVGNRVVAGDVGMFKKSIRPARGVPYDAFKCHYSIEEKVDSFRRPVAGAASERLPALMARGCARPGPARCNRLISGRPGRSRPHTFRFNLLNSQIPFDLTSKIEYLLQYCVVETL